MEPLSCHWSQCVIWIAHVVALNNAMIAARNTIRPCSELAKLLQDGAIYLWEKGLLDQARELSGTAMSICEKLPDDKVLLSEVNSFHACIIADSSNAKEACKLFERSLDNIKEHIARSR